MKISLVVIRLEVADDCQIPTNFKPYCAPLFGHAEDKDSHYQLSYAHVTKQHPSSSKENSLPKPITLKAPIAECRGSRVNEDICITYISSEEIQKMEKELEECDTQQAIDDENDKQKVTEDGKHQTPTKQKVVEDAKEMNSTDGKQQIPNKASTPELMATVTRELEVSPREQQDPSSTRLMRCHKSDDSWENSEGPGPTPGSPGKQLRSQSPLGRHSSTVHFSTGNPGVEQVKGILHLFKDSKMTSLDENVPRSEMLCMMTIPAAYTIHDLIQFTAPLNGSMEGMQVLKGTMRNQYMLLIKFKDQKATDEFYSYFNNRPFNSIEEYMCHLVYVAQVEMSKESEGGSLPIRGLTELPHCPVCLERMEESVDGILTVLCNHSFHMTCLAQWGDTTCPVCRYCQTPEELPDQRCMQCGSQESLWICLICGCIGCGRYVGLHAYKHFQDTNHTYAMQLGTNHVWDYAGDNYVHRLAQNKSDGKLVQLGEHNSSVTDEKLDSITLEYTYLLTTQLESQRRFFEEKIIEETKEANLRVKEREEQLTALSKEKDAIAARLVDSTKEKQALDRKCNQMHSKLGKVIHDLQEEQDMNKCLRENQQLWQKRVTTLETTVQDLAQAKDREIAELRDQLRDVMFYLEAQDTLAKTTDVSQEEIQEGQVIVGAAAAPEASSKKRPKKKR